MNDRPSALELIRIANETLVRTILPEAKPEHLYTLRMIASALGIAARELETHRSNTDDEMQRLDKLYTALSTPLQDTQDLRACNSQFALDIRHGRFENSLDQQLALRQHLVATARAKLASASPKAL